MQTSHATNFTGKQSRASGVSKLKQSKFDRHHGTQTKAPQPQKAARDHVKANNLLNKDSSEEDIAIDEKER